MVRDLIAKICAVLFAGTLLAISIVMLRFPGTGSFIYMGFLYAVYLCFGKKDPPACAASLLRITLTGGMFQFVLALTNENTVFLPWILFCGIFAIAWIFRKYGAEVFVMLIYSVTSLPYPGGMLRAIDGFVLIFLSGVWCFFGICAAELAFPNLPEEQGGEPDITFSRALYLALTISTGWRIHTAFHIPQGQWIAFTVLLVHSGCVFGPAAAQRAWVRVVMTPAGFWAGFCVLYIFCWFDYVFAYTFFIWPLIGNTLLFLTGSSQWRVFFQMIFFILMFDLVDGTYTEPDLLNILFGRTFSIALGAALSILADPEDSPTVPFISYLSQKKSKKFFSRT